MKFFLWVIISMFVLMIIFLSLRGPASPVKLDGGDEAISASRLLRSSNGSIAMTAKTVITFPDGYQLTPLIADNEFEAKIGLSEQLEPTSMLFIFDNKVIGSIWMKGMHFPIDIIWIDGQKVVGFETDVQVENPPVSIYRSPVPIDRVLEVPAGLVKAHNLTVGNQLDIELGKE